MSVFCCEGCYTGYDADSGMVEEYDNGFYCIHCVNGWGEEPCEEEEEDEWDKAYDRVHEDPEVLHAWQARKDAMGTPEYEATNAAYEVLYKAGMKKWGF